MLNVSWLLISTLVVFFHLAWSQTTLLNCLGFDNEKVFVINADDVGMHSSIDKAVFQLYENGKIQSFSLMVPAPNFTAAAAYAIKNNVPVGIHLTLTNEWQEKLPWSAVLSRAEVASLYNDSGRLWQSVQQLNENAKITEIEKELREQISIALNIGLNVTHLDFHMLFQLSKPEYYQLALKLAQDYQLTFISQATQFNLPSQLVNEDIIEPSSDPKSAVLNGPEHYVIYYNPAERAKNPNLSLKLYQQTFNSALPALHHIAVHPAIKTPSLSAEITDADFRYDEFMLFSSEKLNQVIAKNKIKFTNYLLSHRALSEESQCNKVNKYPLNTN